jgi:hypothetical protein
MRYMILSFRYLNEKSIVGYKDTEAEAIKEIDRLAKEEEKNHKWYHGDSRDFTFMPIGDKR